MRRAASDNFPEAENARLVAAARACEICAATLPHPPRPVLSAPANARVVLIGQAPSRRVHEGGKPWDDDAGARLRAWLGLSSAEFYSPALAHLPMGFCYPGAGRGGDAPPRAECAPLWHEALLATMPAIGLKLLIGRHAISRYLPQARPATMTDLLQEPGKIPAGFAVLPHPSRRNRPWLARNPWFEADAVPRLRSQVAQALAQSAGTPQ